MSEEDKIHNFLNRGNIEYREVTRQELMEMLEDEFYEGGSRDLKIGNMKK